MRLPLTVCLQSDGKYANVRDANGHRIAQDLPPDAAALIVTACNAHKELVAALQVQRKVLTTMYIGPPPEKINKAIANIDDALIAAGAA